MRIANRMTLGLSVACLMIGMSPAVQAQNDFPKDAIQKKLQEQFTLTKITADRTDIVQPGNVVVLNKNGLMMYAIASPMPPLNTYKNGKISQGMGGFGRDLGISMLSPGGTIAANYPQRKFVSGEKFWITGFTVQKSEVSVQLYSDPYNDIRYYGQLAVPFPKGAVPSPDDVVKMLSEVVTPVPSDAANQNPQPPPPPVPALAPIPPPAAFAPIAPPPPPPDAPPAGPKTISVGQTKEQVVAIMGPPGRVANVGPKEIDYYPDMKVILIKGKVTDIQ